MKFEVRFILQRLFFIGFWLATCTGFVSDLMWGSGEPSILRTMSLLAVDAIIVLLGVCTIRKMFDIIMIISFLIISYFSTCLINNGSLISWANGLRYFNAILFMVPILRYFWATEYRHDLFVKSLDKQLYIFLWLQVPAVLFQFFMHGAGDKVGGTMGDGFSGVLSFCIYYVSFYLLTKRIDRNNIMRSLYKNWTLIFLLFPTFLNETKISFALIIAYFILLLPIDRKYIIRITFLSPLIIILVGVGSFFYSSTVDESQGKLKLDPEFFEEYLDADLDQLEKGLEYLEKYENEEEFDIPRFTKLGLMPMVFSAHPGNNILGFGINIYSRGKYIEESDFNKEYDWLLRGTSPHIYSTYMQLGIIGSIWMMTFLISLFLIKPKKYPKRDLSSQLFFFIAIIILLLYSDLWINNNFCYIMLTFIMLSWKKSSVPPHETTLTTQ